MESGEESEKSRSSDAQGILETSFDDMKSREAREEEEHNADDEYSTSDKKKIFETSPRRHMSPKVVNNWRILAILICWISIIFSVLFGALLFVFSVEDSSSSAFGFAMTAMLNAMTSSVVIWRYHGALSAFSDRKEDRALVTLGALFVVSAFCTGGSALYYILTDSRPDFSEEAANKLIIVAILAAVTMCAIAATQLFVAKKLESCTLLTDALNSFAGGIVALSVVISYRVGENHPGNWYVDEVTAIIIACFLFIYGVILLAKNVPLLLRSTQYEDA